MSLRQIRWAVGLHRLFLGAASVWLVYAYVQLVSNATRNREFYVSYLENQATLRDPIPPSPAEHSNARSGQLDLDDLANQVAADYEMQQYREQVVRVRAERAQATSDLAQFRASFAYRYPVLAPTVPPYLGRSVRSVLLPVLTAYALLGVLVVASRWVVRGFTDHRGEDQKPSESAPPNSG